MRRDGAARRAPAHFHGPHVDPAIYPSRLYRDHASKHLGSSPYSWRNRLILAHLAPLVILVLALIIGGWRGVLVIVLPGVIGRSFHELINYVKYFGLVRVQNLLPNPLQRAPL